MKRLTALSIALVMVAAACGGNAEPIPDETTTTLPPSSTEVREACADVGTFRNVIKGIAENVSDSGRYTLSMRWRWLPQQETPYRDEEVRFNVRVFIKDIKVEYYDFNEYYLGPAGVFMDDYDVYIGNTTDLEEPRLSLQEVLCLALDDIEHYFGVDSSQYVAPDRGTRTFFDRALSVSRLFVGEHSVHAWFEIDDSKDKFADNNFRYRTKFVIVPYTDESDPYSYDVEFREGRTFFAEAVDDEKLKDALRELYSQFAWKYPGTWTQMMRPDVQS